jgi:hypothetical protein
MPGGIILNDEGGLDHEAMRQAGLGGPGGIGTAPSNENKNGIYSHSLEHRKSLHSQCSGMAKVFLQQPDKRMVYTAAESKNANLKIAAALYWGLVKETDEWLYKAIEDPNPFVAHAAYESCMLIAKDLYGETYPFESTHVHDAEMKDAVRHMTELYFANLKTKTKPSKNKTETKDARKILGLGPND